MANHNAVTTDYYRLIAQNGWVLIVQLFFFIWMTGYLFFIQFAFAIVIKKRLLLLLNKMSLEVKTPRIFCNLRSRKHGYGEPWEKVNECWTRWFHIHRLFKRWNRHFEYRSGHGYFSHFSVLSFECGHLAIIWFPMTERSHLLSLK
jgi:hypothetical protein